MKNLLLIPVLFTAIVTKAQDCYNGGIVSAPIETMMETPTVNFKPQAPLILMPHVMNEKEVTLVIKEKNNSDLNRLLKKVKLAKTFQNIGFAAIPEALIGGGLISVAAISNKGTMEQRSVGVGLVALSAACLSSSLCFKLVRTKNYKKAIARYNQLYN